jgi:hypothetical protein
MDTGECVLKRRTKYLSVLSAVTVIFVLFGTVYWRFIYNDPGIVRFETSYRIKHLRSPLSCSYLKKFYYFTFGYNENTGDRFKQECKILAESGDAVAQYEMAQLLLSSPIDNILHDYLIKTNMQLNIDSEHWGEALRWVNLAAKQSYIPAITALGIQYFFGEHIEGNIDNAFQFFQLSAKGGDVYGPMFLSIIYKKGLGRPKDLVKSLMWIEVAKSYRAPDNLRDFLGKKEIEMSAEMTKEQIEEAHRMAKEH